jgi:hypothetical protein
MLDFSSLLSPGVSSRFKLPRIPPMIKGMSRSFNQRGARRKNGNGNSRSHKPVLEIKNRKVPYVQLYKQESQEFKLEKFKGV